MYVENFLYVLLESDLSVDTVDIYVCTCEWCQLEKHVSINKNIHVSETMFQTESMNTLNYSNVYCAFVNVQV